MAYNEYQPYGAEYPDFKGYDNFVLAEQIKSSLDTKLDINRFLTADYSLAEAPGMVKKIHKYSVVNGVVDDLDRGQGNSNVIEAAFEEVEYRVKRTQGQINYFDDDLMTDPTLIDSKVRFLSEAMVNDWTRKAIAEFGKTENVKEIASLSIDNLADAITLYTGRYETTEGLFILANQKQDAVIRKMLEPELRYVEDYVRTGAIGAIWGIPVYLSKAVPENMLFLATREAVTAFVKKAVNVEQDRNVDTKLNKVVASRYSVIALTDDTRCIAIGPAQSTKVSLTTPAKDDVAIAGSATDGAKVTAYVNGKEVGSATASSGFSIDCEALAANDVVKVVAVLAGTCTSTDTATVSA